jgi:hypothetical protein
MPGTQAHSQLSEPLEQRGARGGRFASARASSQTLDAPQRSDADTDDHVFHYVRKAKIAESAVLGTMVEALCGEVFPVTRAPKPGSPVCQACREIYQALPGD